MRFCDEKKNETLSRVKPLVSRMLYHTHKNTNDGRSLNEFFLKISRIVYKNQIFFLNGTKHIVKPGMAPEGSRGVTAPRPGKINNLLGNFH